MRRGVRVLISLVVIAGLACSVSAQTPKDRHTRLDRLGLSSDQSARIKQLLRSNRADGETARQALRADRMRLFSMYDSYRLNETTTRDLMNRVNRGQRELLKNSLEREIGLRAVLTQEQFTQLRRMMGPERGPERFGEGPVPGRGREPDARPGLESHARRLPELQLSSDQQSAVERLWLAQDKASESAMHDMGRNLRSVQALYADYHLDEQAARRLIVTINRSQMRLMQARLDAQIGLRKILSEDQFRTLAEHVRKTLKAPNGPARQAKARP
jgi:Spy/CpxP family protein refolding chaperone